VPVGRDEKGAEKKSRQLPTPWKKREREKEERKKRVPTGNQIESIDPIEGGGRKRLFLWEGHPSCPQFWKMRDEHQNRGEERNLASCGHGEGGGNLQLPVFLELGKKGGGLVDAAKIRKKKTEARLLLRGRFSEPSKREGKRKCLRAPLHS